MLGALGQYLEIHNDIATSRRLTSFRIVLEIACLITFTQPTAV